MSFKKMMLIISVTMIVIILCLLGVSYAYYSLSNASTQFQTTTGEDVSVIYEQSQYINVSTGVPLSSSEASEKASSSKFSALAGNEFSGYQVAIQISLVDIIIDSALKISDFKIQFLENGTVISNLTGADITSSTLTVKPMSRINVGTTYNYELKIWLNDTGVSQNELMGKKFSGRFEVSSSVKK